MKIGIATPVLIDGDAVGNDVFSQYLSLKKKYDVHLFAEHSRVAVTVSHITNAKKVLSHPDDVYIYHHSINCEHGVKNLIDLKCKKVVKYHNITPPSFFDEGSHIANECKKGIDQLADIIKTGCKIWSDSDFNGEDLRKIDPKVKYVVLPPFSQTDHLVRTNQEYQNVLNFDDWNTNIIMVGRVAHNKNVSLGIKAFHRYAEKYNLNSRLIIIGDNGMVSYVREMEDLIRSLDLGRKIFMTGKVPLPTLKSFYLIADALLVTSKHEGFCVPLVEAMAFGVPIVAGNSTAIPYTAGEAAVLVSDSDPEDVADGIEKILSNREDYTAIGWKRFKSHFKHDAIENKLYELVEGL